MGNGEHYILEFTKQGSIAFVPHRRCFTRALPSDKRQSKLVIYIGNLG